VFDGRLRCALQRNLRRQKYARFISPPTPLQTEAKTHAQQNKNKEVA
ncbi:autoinducer 2 ABC transporter permease LsrC, partial [Salmonella enterica]